MERLNRCGKGKRASASLEECAAVEHAAIMAEAA